MENKDKFYVIKIINTRNGKRGYIGESNGEIIISDQLFQATKMFPTYQDAQKYIRENKLERNGITCHIRDNEDLMKDANNPFGDVKNMKQASGDVYLVVNSKGQRCFYDSKLGYFFKDGEVGCIAFFSEKEVNDFISKHFPTEAKPFKLSNKSNQ